MSSPENIGKEILSDSVGAINQQRADEELFPGDRGELLLETRRILVQLLSGPSLDARRHSRLWAALIRDEGVVRQRLNELFLELVIDRDLQIAFVRQVDGGDLEVPLLLRRAQLTFIDSILLLDLRRRLAQAESHGERAVVSTSEIFEYLHAYDRMGNTDRAGFDKKIHASIEKIKKHSILHKIRSTDDRFEVSPTLKLLFSVEKIQKLTLLYKDMAAAEMAIGDEDSSQNEESE